MDYDGVPTAVFSPSEYGCVGLAEEEARARHAEGRVEVFLSEFTTLELGVAGRGSGSTHDGEAPPNCLAKLVCLRPGAGREGESTGGAEDEDSRSWQVVGFHFVGPNAGEVTQGFALALRLGATKGDFDDLVGIHPTDAESFTSLSVTRSSGLDWVSAGGCGGGKCG
jgi:thioredoxin reductase (NADPH)